MAVTLANVDELIEGADGDFDQLVRALREAVRPKLDGDWTWKLPSGRQVRIDDLPIEVIERVAEKHSMAWTTLMRWPGETPSMAWDIYLECCKFGGEDPVDRPAKAGDFLEFTALIEKIPHDRPTSHGDGGVPLEGESSIE